VPGVPEAYSDDEPIHRASSRGRASEDHPQFEQRLNMRADLLDERGENMDFLWATIILAIWGAVGPLVGIYIGHQLLRDQHRRQWLADNKIQEWREVITTLQRSLVTIVQYDATKDLSTVEEKAAAMPSALNARAVALEVLGNRLFIANEVRYHKMFDKWHQAVKEFDVHRDPAKIGALHGELVVLITQAAKAEMSKL
jgi:hypothetical protein